MVVIKGRIKNAKPQEGTRPIHRKRNGKKSSVPRPLIRGKAGGRLKVRLWQLLLPPCV